VESPLEAIQQEISTTMSTQPNRNDSRGSSESANVSYDRAPRKHRAKRSKANITPISAWMFFIRLRMLLAMTDTTNTRFISFEVLRSLLGSDKEGKGRWYRHSPTPFLKEKTLPMISFDTVTPHEGVELDPLAFPVGSFIQWPDGLVGITNTSSGAVQACFVNLDHWYVDDDGQTVWSHSHRTVQYDRIAEDAWSLAFHHETKGDGDKVVRRNFRRPAFCGKAVLAPVFELDLQAVALKPVELMVMDARRGWGAGLADLPVGESTWADGAVQVIRYSHNPETGLELPDYEVLVDIKEGIRVERYHAQFGKVKNLVGEEIDGWNVEYFGAIRSEELRDTREPQLEATAFRRTAPEAFATAPATPTSGPRVLRPR